MGVETTQLTEVPAGHRDLKKPVAGPVRWVYTVTDKAVVVTDGPDGYPQFATADPSVLQTPAVQLTV